MAKDCTLCVDTGQKEQMKSQLSYRIHSAVKGGHKAALKLLLDMGADINERNSGGTTALLEAVFYNHPSCIKILIERGADTTIPTSYGRSMLHRAAWESTDGEVMTCLLDVVKTRKMVDMKDSIGNTPLHDCCSEDDPNPILQLENAKMLVQASATLTIKNSERKTPYKCARDRERKELAKYLWSQLSPEEQADELPPPSSWWEGVGSIGIELHLPGT